jgi:hypothetical protein
MFDCLERNNKVKQPVKLKREQVFAEKPQVFPMFVALFRGRHSVAVTVDS